MQTTTGRNETEQQEIPSFTAGRTGADNDRQENSSNSEGPSNGSKKQWPKPTNVSELAKQTNDVATMLLNGEIDLQVASKYATMARTTAQLKSLEAAKAKQERTKIDLSL